MPAHGTRGRPDGRPLVVVRRAAAIAAVAVLGGLTVACLPQPEARDRAEVELRWTLPPAGAAGLARVVAHPSWAGVNRGLIRDENWWPLVATDAPVVLPDGAAVAVARGRVRAGAYDRVFVASPVVEATAADGTPARLVSHIEPIALPLDLAPGSRTVVEIELVVLPLPGWRGGGWAIFVKAAREVAPEG
jgi:hypothetical protein